MSYSVPRHYRGPACLWYTLVTGEKSIFHYHIVLHGPIFSVLWDQPLWVHFKSCHCPRVLSRKRAGPLYLQTSNLCSHPSLKNFHPFSVTLKVSSPHFSTLCEHNLSGEQKEALLLAERSVAFNEFLLSALQKTLEARNKVICLKWERREQYRRRKHTK